MKNFIARQPIFHKENEVLGYEVLFRGGPENFCADTGSDISTISLDSLLQFGVDRVTSGRLAFVNCSRDVLLRDHLTLLPPERVVGEVLETVDADAEVMDACRRLKRAGYRLALDDFVDSPSKAPLVEIADYVKVDFLATSPAEQERLARELLRRNVSLIAEKVETQEAFKKGMAMGYRYFQGYFFCHPQMAERRSIPAQKINYLRILQLANQPEIDIDELSEAIKLEASLIYRLLRFLNSPVFGLRTTVGSIAHALSLLGENGIRKWISLTSLAVMGEDKSTELVTVPLVRARFCELLAAITSLRARAHELFLMGLLSGMDAILETPMSALLDGMPVSQEIREALLHKSGQFRDVYEIVANYETGAWEPMLEAVGRSKVDQEVVPEFFLKSLDWANQVMSTS